MKRSAKRKLIRYGVYAGVLLALLIAVWLAGRNFRYTWQWGRFFEDWAPILGKATLLTLAVAFSSLLLALPLGIVIGLCRTARDPGARLFGFVYVEIVRGTPLLVQVFIWNFVIGNVLPLSPFTASVGALSCFTASYIAEIVRAGIQGVDPGQVEAARSLGMTHVQTLRYVVLPQAFRTILPPLASEFIALVKDSSLASVIGYKELTKQAQNIQGGAYMSFEPWLSVAAIYLTINVILSLGVRLLERKLDSGTRESTIR